MDERVCVRACLSERVRCEMEGEQTYGPQRHTSSVSQSAVQPTHPEETEAAAKAQLLRLPVITPD